MADTNHYNIKKQQQKQQQQQKDQDNVNKIYSNFLYKALIVSTFLIILAFFPSEAPDFVNQTLNTRGWEFLHILFVGIAVSYGLFSRKNEDPEKENINNSSKFDNAQSYVSKILNVSSIFDDEVDNPHRPSDAEKVQAWNSRYYRNEPGVVVVEESSVLDQEQSVGVSTNVNNSSKINEKPLLLPVRSLKSSILDSDSGGGSKESNGLHENPFTRSGSSSSGSTMYSRSKSLDHHGSKQQEIREDKLKETVAVSSPIPWTSRSEKLDAWEEVDHHHSPPPSFALPPSYEQNRTFKEQVQQQSSRPGSASNSPKLPSSPRNRDDFMRRKSVYRFPPPPPSLPVFPKSIPTKPSFQNDDEWVFELNRADTSDRTIRSSGKEPDNNARQSRGSVAMPTFMEYGGEVNEEFIEKLVLESDEDLESDDDYDGEGDHGGVVMHEEAVSSGTTATSLDGDEEPPDVDKKADEFIAKFREQIRLQRIESIKRSSSQFSTNKKQQSR